MTDQERQQPKMIAVPLDRVSPEALYGIIEEFVTREGTEYGHTDYSLQQKIAQVEQQLHQGLAIIAFDAASESCTIIPASKWHRQT